jgi:cell division inhibitor SulA
MPQYLIERNIPGIECMTSDELASVARKSNRVLADLGTEIQWLHSYVVNGKTYCVYIAPDEELIREHARMTGFPCNRIIKIEEVISPNTGLD